MILKPAKILFPFAPVVRLALVLLLLKNTEFNSRLFLNIAKLSQDQAPAGLSSLIFTVEPSGIGNPQSTIRKSKIDNFCYLYSTEL